MMKEKYINELNLKENTMYLFVYENILPKKMEKEYGMICSFDTDSFRIFNEKGKIQQYTYDQIEKATEIINYPNEALKLFIDRCEAFKQEEKLRKQIQELEKKIEDIENSYDDFSKKITIYRGLLSSDDFVKEIRINLTGTKLLNEIASKDFQIELIDFNHENTLRITFKKYFYSNWEKDFSVRNLIELNENAEFKQYEKILLNKYGQSLMYLNDDCYDDLCRYVVPSILQELTLKCSYIFNLDQPLTKEYAKEIAKKICKQ